MFTKNLVHLALALVAATQLASAAPHRVQRRHQPVVVNAEDCTTEVVEVAKTVWVNEAGQTVDPNVPIPPVVVTVTEGPKPTNPPPAPKPPVVNQPAPKPPVVNQPAPKPPVVEKPKPQPPVIKQPEPQPPVVKQPVPEPKPEPKPPVVKQPVPEPKPEPKPPVVKQPEPKPKPEPKPTPAPAPGVAPGSKPGIVYSPYNPNPAGGRQCKSEEEMAADIQKLAGFSPLRLYSTDCHQIDMVLKYGAQQIFIGLDNAGSPDNEVQDVIRDMELHGNPWDRIHTVGVGNEVLQFGKLSEGEWAAAINGVRGQLRGKGYSGPVVGVDTFVSMAEHPAICQASDYVAVNAHPFFDGGCTPEGSGEWIQNMAKFVGEKMQASGCNKKIMFTEVGWPTQGGAKSEKAVPGVSQQSAALKSLHGSLGNNFIVFTAFDDKWKADTDQTLGTEQHWGVADLSVF